MKYFPFLLFAAALSAQTRSGVYITGTVNPLTLNQYDVNLTTYGSGGWRFFGSSWYSENKAASSGAISALTNTNAGKAFNLTSKVLFQYWSDGAASAPFHTAVNGSSAVAWITNVSVGKKYSGRFQVVCDGLDQLLSVYVISASGAAPQVTASLPGAAAYSSSISPPAKEGYTRFDVTFKGGAGSLMEVTVLNTTDGASGAGQPAIGVASAALRDLANVPNLQPVNFISRLTDQYAALPATVNLYYVSPKGVITKSDGTVVATRDFQALLNAAVDGDEYRFADGYVAGTTNADVPFILPVRPAGTGYVKLVGDWIHTSVAQRQRVNPGDFPLTGARRPRLEARYGGPVLGNDYDNPSDAARPTARWYIEGFEFAVTGSVQNFGLIWLFPANVPTDRRSRSSTVPTSNFPAHIIFEHLYMHGSDTVNSHNALSVEANHVTVQDSYISNIWSNDGKEPEAWHSIGGGWNSLFNNFLEATGENVMLGADAPTTSVHPHDTTMRYNVFFKRRSWEHGVGSRPGNNIKNLAECKDCNGWIFEYNVLLNGGLGFHQAGAAVLITPRITGDTTSINAINVASTARNIHHRFNLIMHQRNGYSIAPLDDKMYYPGSPYGYTADQVAQWAPRMVPGADMSITDTLILDLSNGKYPSIGGGGANGFILARAPYNAGAGSVPNSIVRGSQGQNFVISRNTIASDVPLAGGTLDNTFAFYMNGAPGPYPITGLPDNTEMSSNIFTSILGADGTRNSGAMPNGSFYQAVAVTQKNNCLTNNYKVNTDFAAYGAAGTIFNATCPSSVGAPANLILNLEGAIRSGNRAAIYPNPQ